MLRLEVREFRDLDRWRWVLTDAGQFLADHEVRLDASSWQYEAFGDLAGYLSWHVAPDRRRADEARIIGEVGAWIGTQVLGPVAAALARLARSRPVTVRVVVPPDAATTGAGTLLFRPLELAHVNGKPLSVQDVTLVMDAGQPAGVASVGERLRILGLFSLPEGKRALNLRRERQALVSLVRGVAATGKAIDVRVLQYGVTRDRLRDELADGAGWDIIHICGHGRPGELLLETAAGDPDLVAAAELADLLDLAREHVKLVTVSACWSAAAAEQRHLLGLPAHDDSTERTRADAGTGAASGALATELAGRLGCAVLAMRYPVTDDFALELTAKLYDLLIGKGQPLPRAVGMTLRQLASAGSASAGPTGAGPDGAQAFPALSVATPALFGAAAADLRLAAPVRLGPLNYDTGLLTMAGFPDEPERFVGRTGVMARASAALAAASGLPGVLLHGMPGGGKTAAGLELAYGHQHAFGRCVWFKAPDEGLDIAGALTDFALTMERSLDGFRMVDVLADPGKLAAFLPRLTELMERFRVLVVIDNAESLLTEPGQWRDDRWGAVIRALCAHRGLGRVILTSRRVPAALTGLAGLAGVAGLAALAGLRVEAVDALSADEAVLLVRELPHLQALGEGKFPGIDRLAARQLARRAVVLARGHPKLLELANGQAAHPEQLAALLDAGGQAWRRQGGLPDGFFADGEATASAADYVAVLAAWTRSVAETLTPGERDLFWLLCCLEEPDRERTVVETTWPPLWGRLGRDGEPPGLSLALAAIVARGLARIREAPDGTGPSYPVHPGVAEAGRGHAGQPFRDAIDAEAAAYWTSVYRQASGQASGVSVDTGLLVRAGLAAVPYLLRQHQWNDAASLLQPAFDRDPSRANAAAMLPAIQQIARHEPRWTRVLARVLAVIDPAAADTLLRTSMADAAARGDYQTASSAASWLITLCRDGGRLAEALDLAGQMAGYTRQAGLGPWTQLADEVQRLQVLNYMEQADQVLDEVARLRAHLATLPTAAGPNEAVTPWDVREFLLDAGRAAALRLGRPADALTLNAEIIDSLRDRRAPAADVARTRLNDYSPLLSLGRIEEALPMLLDCRQTFEDAHDTKMLGKTVGALANAEDERGHVDAAIHLQRDALRYNFLTGDVNSVVVSYHFLGRYLHHARQFAPALASHLAAALVSVLTGAGDIHQSVPAAAADLREPGSSAVPPADVADLCHQVGDTPGSDPPGPALAGLLAKLSPDPETAEQALRDIIAQARELAAAPLDEAGRRRANGSPHG